MKRFFTRWLFMTVLLMAGLTTAVAQQSVLDENFANGTLPQGWNKAGNYWDFSEFNAKFYAPFENAVDTLYAPVVSLSELKNEPTVTFSYSLGAAGTNVNSLTLLYRAGLEGAWDTLAVFDQATSGETSFVQALPKNLTSIQLAIAAAYKAGGSTYVYQLRVANKKEATTAPANFKAENLLAYGVKLTWDASESDYFEKNNLKLSTSPLTDPDQEMGDVKNFMGETGLENEWCELSDLEPNTKYYAYVQYDCGYGDVSPWAELNFTTPCVAMQAPLYEDFENGLSSCYTIYKKGSATTAEVSGEYPYNSTASFKVNIEGTADFSNYLVLPELEGDLKNYQISFMAASAESGNTYSRRVAVGVCTDVTNVADTYSEITTLDLPKGRTWENIVVSLKGYTGAGKYITLKIGHPSMKTNLFIDDIRVEPASACPKPMFVQVSNVSTGSATVSWTKTGSENEWNLVVSTKPLADPEDIEPNENKGEFAGSVSTNPYTLNGLKPNTTYYAYVQAACGSSEWTEAIEFKTQREITYPYSEHFDRMDPTLYTNTTAAIPEGWVFDDRTTLASDASYYDKQYSSDTYRPYVTTKQNHEATAYVKASLLLRGTGSGTGSTKNISSIAIAPAMPKPVNTMMVTFWAYASSAQTVKIGVANTQTNDLAQGQQLGANITEVGEAAITGGSVWKQYKVLLTGYTGTGRYITFYLKPGTSTPSVYIDDIEIDEAPDCNAINTLTAEATGIDKATATWTDASSSASWTIKVSSTEIDPSAANGDIVAAQTVNTKTYNISGLAMGQTYYIYVSPSCGDAWVSTTVTTLVGLQVPYYNDFTSENTGANATRGPKNWTLGLTYTDAPGATSSNWPHVNTTAWTNAPADVEKNSVYFNNSTTTSAQFPYAIMPELLNGNVKDMKIGFYAYWNNAKPSNPANYACVNDSYYGVLKIGVVSSPTDINKTNKFTKVTEVAAVRCKEPKAAEYFVVDMSKYTGSGKYIVFYQDTAKNNYMMIDNLTISLATDPQPVSDVEASEITKTGAKLTWTENGKAAKWEVKVFAEVPEDPETAEAVWSATVTEKQAVATGLNHSTQYYAYVRSVQDNGNGAWGSTSFFTECGTFATPFTEDWESWATGANTLSACFTQTAGMQVAGSSSPNATVKTGNCIKFNATTTNKEPMLVLPEFDKPIKTLQLTMNASPYTASYVGDASYTEIGVLEADDNFVKIAEYRFNLSDAKAWDEVFVNFGSYTGDGGRIAIRSPYATVNKQTHICFDNLVVEEIPLCGKITTIEVENIDSVSAKVSWAKGKTENAWNLKVSSTELEDPATATADVFDAKVTEQTKTLTNLEGNTTYYVYVQSVDEVLECEGQWSNAKSFKTTCKKATFPYEEDFESYETSSGKDLGCNTLCGPDNNHSYIYSKNNSKMLYLRQATKGNHNYFVFPALAIDSVKRLQLSMQVYSGGTTATTKYAFEVGIMTDPNDPGTFVATHKDTVMGSATAYDRVYIFDKYAGDETGEKFGTFIALKATEYTTSTGSTGAGYVYIDNVYIDFIETCFAPTDLKTDSVGTYAAKLIWNSDNKTVDHRIRIYDNANVKPSSEEFVKEMVVKDTVALIEGLNALTNYYAFVRKECSANDKSKWSSVCQFRTECPEAVTLPYAEDFEAFATSTAPDCWTAIQGPKVSGAGGSTTQANATVVTTAASGSRGLQISSSGIPTSASANPSYVYSTASIVTPKLDVNSLKDITMYFDVKGASAGATLKIEAVADKEKDADAIYITTLSNIPATWMKAYIKLEELYTSVQPYKYLRFTPTTNGNSIYIDNIVFTTESNVVLPVEALKAQMLSESTIKFSFAEYTPTINQWQVAYVVAGGDIADAKILTIDATEYTITGLAPNTSYDIYVRGNVEGDQWVGPLTATTIQTPTPLPLITGFEDAEDNAKWNLYNVQTVQGNFYPNFWIVGGADKCAGTGNNALFITNDSASYQAYGNDTKMNPADYPWMSSVTSSSSVWATRNIKIEDVGTYKFGFKIKVPSTYGTYYSAYAQLIPAGATFKAGSATLISGTTRSGSATKNENGCYVVMNSVYNTPEWKWVNTSMDIETPGIYTLAIYWTNLSAVAANPYETGAAIDSVIVEEYLCTTPKDIKFANRTATEVSIQWFGGKCKNFEYVVSKYANLGMPNLIDEEDKVAYGTLNDGPQVTIKDLIPNSAYSFYVRTICPDGYTDWVEYDFETPCALEELPYTESFSETPECWILKSASATTANYKTPEMETAEKWTCLQLNNGGLAILPELAVDLKNVEVELALFNSTSLGAVQLGVMDNTWDASTFKEIAFFQTVNKLTSTTSGNPYILETFSKMMNLYQGTGKVLAIKNATSNTVYVKYVKLTELPDCVKPQQVELTFIKDSEVTVNWLAGLEEAWEIKINDSIIENVTTNPYRITGLEQGTTYTISVRALCDENTKSEWSLPATFQSACAVNPLPLFEDFSGLAKPATSIDLKKAMLICWDNMVSQNNIDQVFAGKESPFTPANNVYVGDSWVSNWVTALGDYAQLHSYRRDGPTYRYKWFVSPQYAIEGDASLSFDIRVCNNVGNAAKNSDRTYVAISLDNGKTWKKEDATLLTNLDSVYTTKVISLSKYAGKNIRVAFYDENFSSSHKYGEQPFLLIDNVRMNCSEKVVLSDNACQGYDYENYGFSIKQEDLPLAGEDSTYTRLALSQSTGCDTVYELTLTTRPKPQSQTIYATICQGEGYPFGDWYLTEPNPENQPYYITAQNEYGCDVYTYLYLTVNPSDTTLIAPIAITNDMLPYKVDESYTIPANQPVGKDTVIVKKGESCSFNKYFITIDRCQRSTLLSDTICEDVKAYSKYNFDIEQDSLPAVNEQKRYEDTIRTKQGCDSVVSLILFVFPNDTITIDTAVYNSELLLADVKVDDYFSIEKGTEVGKYDTLLSVGNCEYRYYRYEVNQCTTAETYVDTICANDMSYVGYGFNLTADQLPAPGTSKNYSHVDRTANECDSTTNLKLTVVPAVTNIIPVTVLNSELPFKVDSFYTIPAGIPVGSCDTVVSIGFCSYNKYQVTIQQCEIPVKYSAQICENAESYSGYGFVIPSNEYPELPAPLTSKVYTRHAMDILGCDSIISLTLTSKNDTTDIHVAQIVSALPYVVDEFYTVPADATIGTEFEVIKPNGLTSCSYNRYIVMISDCGGQVNNADTVCADQTSYQGYGFVINSADMPEAGKTKSYHRIEPDGDNCKNVTLTLSVLRNDTIDKAVTIYNTDLPYVVDEFYTVPESMKVGSYTQIVKLGDAGCSYIRYNVTINQKTAAYSFADAICEDATSYEGYGFVIPSDNYPALPAPGSNLNYVRHAMDNAGVDSVITFTLTTLKADTVLVPVQIENTQLPYTVDEFYTVPADALIDVAFNYVVKTGDCEFNNYAVYVTRCVEEYSYTDSICESATAYDLNGFAIAADELPAAGQSKIYTRKGTHITSVCDSLVSLTLYVMKNDTTTYEDAICETQTAYQGYGFMLSADELPAIGASAMYYRTEQGAEGCDSIIALALAVIPNDTTVKTVSIDNTRLPYEVDPYYTVPADAVIGETYEQVVRLNDDECAYRKYVVTVTQCSRTFSYAETLCEGQTSYEGYGFNIAEEDMPAIGGSKEYNRSNMSEQGCDSLITLTLIIKAADTTHIAVNIDNIQLPYYVDPYYTVPVGAILGEPFDTIVKWSDMGCAYNRYTVNINKVECSTEYSFADSICALAESYEGYGFIIGADKLPAAGTKAEYTRIAADAIGCDSVITLTLMSNKPDTLYIMDTILVNALPYVADGQTIVPAGAPAGDQPAVTFSNGECAYITYLIHVLACEIPVDLSDDVCAGSDYKEYGFDIKASEMPVAGQSKEYTRTSKDAAGCDSIITLTLTVKGDTTYLDPIEINEDQLPYQVNEFITIPAGTPVGVYEEVIQIPGDCQFIAYTVTIHEQGFGIIHITDAVESIEVYDLLGHKITTIRSDEEAKSLPTGVYMLRSIMKSGQIVNSKAALK